MISKTNSLTCSAVIVIARLNIWYTEYYTTQTAHKKIPLNVRNFDMQIIHLLGHIKIKRLSSKIIFHF